MRLTRTRGGYRTMKSFGESNFCLYFVRCLCIIIIWMPMVKPYRHNSHRIPLNITASTGITVDLKCKVRLNECGNFYSIEWYWQKDQNQRKPSRIVPPHQHDETLVGTVGKKQTQNTLQFDNALSATSDFQTIGLSIPNGGSLQSERVYVYRHYSGVAKAENRWKGRAVHIYDTQRHMMRIRLSRLKLEDQASYRCEITYEEAGRWFKDSCLTPQVTQLNVIGGPTYVKVSLENDTEIATVGGAVNSKAAGGVEDDIISAAVIGPYRESSELVLRCKAGGGRPVPEVSWWKGNQEIVNSWHWKKVHDNGTGSTQSEINVLLQRDHLGASFTCRVNSSAMSLGPILRTVYIDMELPPLTLDMIHPVLDVNEVSSPISPTSAKTKTISSEVNEAAVDEGGKISITCIAKGAKPQAYIYWNSDPPLNFDDIHEETKREENGLTFTTINRLTFEAERQLTSLSCFASNSVLDDKKGTPLKRATNIHVKYKPEIETKHGPEVVEVVQGETVSIKCKFNANPMHGTKVLWYKDGSKIDFEGKDQESFTIDNIPLGSPKIQFEANNLENEGKFACSAENALGSSEVVEVATVRVVIVPSVHLRVYPREPVSELKNSNVTLSCEENAIVNRDLPPSSSLNTINSKSLMAVKWYLDGDLLKHVVRKPECISSEKRNSAMGFHCNVDPSKIILVNVRRSFHGNYSCRGRNRAGWGHMSPAKELRVTYPPSKTTISHEPLVVLKGKPFKIKCSVEEPGYPAAHKVRWFRNGVEVPGNGGFILANREAHVASAGNYTCIPYNRVGNDEKGAKTNIKIHAAPTFLTKLPSVTGIPFSRKSVQLTCTVECDPKCSISWYRNDVTISDNHFINLSEFASSSYANEDKSKYIVRTTDKSPSIELNRLRHVESVLELDFEKWFGSTTGPYGTAFTRKEKELDVASYSCRSTSNAVGLGVRSTTRFRVHYPPKNIDITPLSSSIMENFRLNTTFTCRADAYPPAQFYWIFTNEALNISRTIGESSGADLVFHHAVKRDQSGTYTCTAHNALGYAKANATLNVHYPPKCRLRKEVAINGRLKLRCDVLSAFPKSDITYIWYHNNRILTSVTGPLLYISKEEYSEKHQKQKVINNLHIFTTPRDGVIYTTDVPVAEDFVGTFTCEAKNLAGSGERCNVSVNNPVAALAGVDGSNGQAHGEGQINYTYVAVGGGAVTVIVFVFALLSILICRKRYGFSGAKYSLNNVGRSPGGRSMDETVGSEGSKATSALLDHCANTPAKCSLRSTGGHNSAHGKYEAYRLHRL